MNISLLQFEPLVRRRVKDGEFANASEFIRHCVRVTEAVEKRRGPSGAAFATRKELEHILEESFASARRPITDGLWRELEKEARS